MVDEAKASSPPALPQAEAWSMKILIAYYSRTGQTEKVAEAIQTELKRRGHSVDIEKVRPIKERSWRGWFFLRIFKAEVPIREASIKNVSNYDIICLGSPNWSRLSLPLASYIKELNGLEYKNVGVFRATTLWPRVEQYFFSAYLFDLTFSNALHKKGARIIDSVLFSSFFKIRSVDSDFGRKTLKSFCDNLERPITSPKDYFLGQKEVENTRLLLVLFSSLLLVSLVFQAFSSIWGTAIFTWQEYFSLFIISLFSYLAMLIMMAGKTGFFFAKYIAGLTLVSLLTITTLFLSPELGRFILLGYVLIFVLFSFFYDPGAVFFVGAITFFGYLYLLFNYPLRELLHPAVDISFIFFSMGLVGFITKDLRVHYISLLEAQEEMETARTALEVKVAARTRELEEFSKRLEGEVKEKTEELQKRIEELERFQRLTVDRELRMIELKKEIKKLKKEE